MNILISTLALLVLVAPSIIFAQTPTPTSLINLPVSPQPGTGGFSGYINLLYGLSISVAALLAVIKIIIAGVKYMLTDVVTSKGEAIKEIKGALLGLLLIIGAVLILTVINPKLLDATLKFNPQPTPKFTPTSPVIPSGTGTSNVGQTNGTSSSTSGGSTTGGGTTSGGTTSGGGTSGGTTTQFDPSCIKGTKTQNQGTVTYQYFDLKSCGFANIATARDYLYNEICKPNAVLNAGNDTFYCKQS